MATGLDIIAVGDAIVDVIASCDDAFLAAHQLAKGSMRLLGPAEAEALYADMDGARESSGGSAANSMAGIAAMGGRAGFIGQIADDPLGRIFAHDMAMLGVDFRTPPLARADGGATPPTGRCLILVTPDAQRTMSTSPGASHELAAGAIDPAQVASAAILYLEGYLFGPDKPRGAMMHAVDIAHAAGREVAFTLSESVGIAGHRDGLAAMIEGGGIDLLFANEDELGQLTGRGDFDQALADIAARVATVVVTRGPDGAVAIERGQRVAVAAAPIEQLVDTTGAGDLFAAGFLAARARRQPLGKCLETGARAAAEVIQMYGARPLHRLDHVVTA